MATGDRFGRKIDALTFKHLNNFAGPPQSREQEFLYPHSRDVAYFKEDFLGPVINTNGLSLAGAGGTTLFANSTSGFSGVATGVVTQDATVISMSGANIWSPSKNCGMRVVFKMSTVAHVKWEIGFVDIITSGIATMLSDIDTPSLTNGATNAGLVCQDTEQTLTTMALVVKGSQSSGTTSKTNIGTLVPVAATYMEVVVQCVQVGSSAWSDVLCLIDDNPTQLIRNGTTSATATGLNANCALMPWMAFSRASTTTLTVTIDSVEVWQDR